MMRTGRFFLAATRARPNAPAALGMARAAPRAFVSNVAAQLDEITAALPYLEVRTDDVDAGLY